MKSKLKHSFNQRFFLISLVAIMTTGCNFWSVLDGPSDSNDLQLLSAARACFDQQDYDCAEENYNKVSDAYADEKNSELAFLILEREGVGMQEIIGTLGENDPGGASLSSLANTVASISDATKRAAVFAAFANVSSITSAELRGLVRFAVAYAVIGVVLGEMSGADNTLQKTDLAAGGASCPSDGTAAASAQCDAVVTTTGTTFDFDDATASTTISAATPTLEMIDAGLAEIFVAFGATELGANGQFAGLGQFSQIFDALAPDGTATSASTRLFVSGLVNNEVGE